MLFTHQNIYFGIGSTAWLLNSRVAKLDDNTKEQRCSRFRQFTSSLTLRDKTFFRLTFVVSSRLRTRLGSLVHALKLGALRGGSVYRHVEGSEDDEAVGGDGGR